jgi:hypothetical protein
VKKSLTLLLIIPVCTWVALCQHVNWAKNFEDAVTNDPAVKDRARDEMFHDILPKLTTEEASLAAAEIPGLAEQLNRKEDKIRLQASAILAALAPSRPDSVTVLAAALPALMDHAQDSVPRIRANSIRALTFLRPDIPAEELQFLIRMMDGNDQALAEEAALGIARMAGSHPDAADAIDRAVSQNDRPGVRLAAIRVLPVAQPIPPRLVSRLGELLTDADPKVVRASLEAISRAGISVITANLNQLNQVAETSSDKELAQFARQLIERANSPH